jgi:hypothetical protein
MDSIAEFKRKYGQKNKKNNDALYKMDWFDNDNFDNMIARPRNRSRKSPPVEKAAVVAVVRSKSNSPRSKSRSSKEKSPLKEIVAAVNLEELVVPSKKASSIVIINPLSPRTRKMRKDLEEQRKQAARDRPVSPKVAITNPNPLRLHMTNQVRPSGISSKTNIEDTTKFPLGRTMHECSRLVHNCQNISQTTNRGAYTIIYNDGSEKVFSTFDHLVKFITDDYMTKNRGRIPHHQRPMHEARVINTLTENGITAAARGVKTRKNNKKRKSTKRNGRK